MYAERYNTILAWSGFAWPKCACCGHRSNMWNLLDIKHGSHTYRSHHFKNQRICVSCGRKNHLDHYKKKGWIKLRSDIDWM